MSLWGKWLERKNVNIKVESLRADYKAYVDSVNSTLAERIKTSEANIQKLEQEIVGDKQLIVNTQNKQKQDDNTLLLKQEEDKKRRLDTIKINEQEIAGIEQQIATIDTNIINTDVGTFKFVAKSLNWDLDKTVNVFILLIIFAFDPLAVALLLCFNHMIKDRPKKIIVVPPPPVVETKIIPEPVTVQPEPSQPVPVVTTKEYPYTVVENDKIAYRSYSTGN